MDRIVQSTRLKQLHGMDHSYINVWLRLIAAPFFFPQSPFFSAGNHLPPS
jgi:hypothetical protein